MTSKKFYLIIITAVLIAVLGTIGLYNYQSRQKVKGTNEPSNINSQVATSRNSQPAIPSNSQVTILKNQTANVFGNMDITLQDIKPRTDSRGYLITAKVKHKDDPTDMTLEDVKEGSIANFPRENGYKITIIKIDAVSATFSISR